MYLEKAWGIQALHHFWNSFCKLQSFKAAVRCVKWLDSPQATSTKPTHAKGPPKAAPTASCTLWPFLPAAVCFPRARPTGNWSREGEQALSTGASSHWQWVGRLPRAGLFSTNSGFSPSVLSHRWNSPGCCHGFSWLFRSIRFPLLTSLWFLLSLLP